MNKFAESDGRTSCEACLGSPMGACDKHPHLVPVSLSGFLEMVQAEVFRARMLFPSCEGVGMALTEEVGEVANAYLDKSREDIIKEGVQACAMVVRLVLEGDPSLAALRAKRKLDL